MMQTHDLHKALDLSGRRALVTGAGRGLGRACALALAAAGARVLATARTTADLDALVARHDGIEPWVADARDAGFYQRIEAEDGLDIAVVNAGTNKPQPFLDVSDDALDTLLELNLRAAFKTAQAAGRVMARRGAGSIILMSSQMGHVGAPDRTVYCMTKHGIEGLTKAAAVELAPLGIRVNSVAPTFIKTPMTEPMLDNPEFAASVKAQIPMGEPGVPEDVAGAVLYLVSDLSRLVTGTSLLVDGGWTAK